MCVVWSNSYLWGYIQWVDQLCLQVWDMSRPQVQLLHTIPTMFSVRRIKWRPQRKFHIANCQTSIHHHINIYDIRRPFMPFACFDGHKGDVTGVYCLISLSLFFSLSLYLSLSLSLSLSISLCLFISLSISLSLSLSMCHYVLCPCLYAYSWKGVK